MTGLEKVAGAHCCSHCDASFESRNVLFRHLRDVCDPSLEAKQETRKERIVLVIGYFGSKYHGCVRNQGKHESISPTVEGAVCAAIQRAWGEDVLSNTRSTRTEKGCHAAENVLVLSLRANTERSDAKLRKELEGSEIWLLAPVAAPAPPVLFDRVHAAKKRVFRVYIPYWALVRAPAHLRAPEVEAELNPPLCCLASQPGEALWLCNLPTYSSEEESVEGVRTLLEECGADTTTLKIEVHPDRGHAMARMPIDLVKELCSRLDGYVFCGAQVTAMPLSEARGKLTLQKEVRRVLKALRGPAKGLQSFHNFMPDGTAVGDPAAKRQLQRCFASSLDADLRLRSAEGPWEDDWTFIRFSAADFAPQQVRRMAGVLVSIMRGAEDIGYVARCFEEDQVATVAAPVEAMSLESVAFGKSFDSDWRGAVGFHEIAEIEMRTRIDAHVREDAVKPWKDVVARIDAGATRALPHSQLRTAAAAGDTEAVLTVLGEGARVDAADEYGRTAAFLAAHAGHSEVIRTLAQSRADLCRTAHGGATLHTAAAVAGHLGVLRVLRELGAGEEDTTDAALKGLDTGVATLDGCTESCHTAKVTVLIPQIAAHAGAGSLTIDDAFDESFLERLCHLWQQLPLAQNEKKSPTERAYFADVEGWVTRGLDAAIVCAGLKGNSLPLMRFLIYPTVGGSLPPHVDLARTDAKGIRSTHTFLLYLTDCTEGGETRLLEGLAGDESLASAGGLQPGDRAVIATAVPQRGRLLLFPHACPHEGAPIVEVPKVLVRGEFCVT